MEICVSAYSMTQITRLHSTPHLNILKTSQPLDHTSYVPQPSHDDDSFLPNPHRPRLAYELCR